MPKVIWTEEGLIQATTTPITSACERVVRCSKRGGTDNKSKLKDREIILSKNNDAIAKWLDRRYEDRTKMMKTLKQRTGQMSLLSFWLPAATRRQNKACFKLAYKRREVDIIWSPPNIAPIPTKPDSRRQIKNPTNPHNSKWGYSSGRLEENRKDSGDLSRRPKSFGKKLRW